MNKDMKKIRILDLFSGTGGFSQGFLDAGYEIDTHYFSEIDRHAIANYKYNFKNSVYVGNVKDIDGRQFRGIDVITFGSPCQDFSIAGQRKGLSGDKSSLLREAIRIVKEARPRVFIWENVKGTFSSNARKDFWAILQAFAHIRGYRLEWQLLNTKWILPQNRERIYLVGILATGGRSWGGIFPVGKNDLLSFSERIGYEKKIQTQNYCSTINPKFGQRAIDSYISVKIQDSTVRGYKIAKVGDSINWSRLKSNTRRGRVGQNVSQTLDTSCKIATLSPDSRIRRFTEVECERLQGFPDNWTRFGIYNDQVKEISKTQRYKMLGNAVTAAVVACVANKLKTILL